MTTEELELEDRLTKIAPLLISFVANNYSVKRNKNTKCIQLIQIMRVAGELIRDEFQIDPQITKITTEKGFELKIDEIPLDTLSQVNKSIANWVFIKYSEFIEQLKQDEEDLSIFKQLKEKGKLDGLLQ